MCKEIQYVVRSHEKYMDTKFKARIWKEIGEELQQPG